MGKQKRETKTQNEKEVSDKEEASIQNIAIQLGVYGSQIFPQNDHDPYTSKIGGRPVWLGEPILHESPMCDSCRRNLFLVAQIYAPIDFPRVVYVFGCNSFNCQLQRGSWKVIRTQIKNSTENKEQEEQIEGVSIQGKKSDIESSTHVVDENTPIKQSSTKIIFEGGFEEKDHTADSNKQMDQKVSNNNFVDSCFEITEKTDDELEDLLASWEQSIPKNEISQKKKKKNNNKKKNKSQKTKNEEKNENSGTAIEPDNYISPIKTNQKTSPKKLDIPCFPAFVVDFWNEETTNQKNYTNFIENDDDDDDDDDEVFSGFNISDEQIRKMLSEYAEQEEDQELLGTLRQSIDRRNQPLSIKSRENEEVDDDKLSKSEKFFLLFNSSLRKCPGQVLRYGYGSNPLWSSPAYTQNLHHIPPCPCGAHRRFEMQLMPPLLFQLHVDEFVSTNENTENLSRQKNSYQNSRRGTTQNTSSGEVISETLPQMDENLMQHFQNGGMDWGTIVIYSCENSCDLSFEEFVIVEPSSFGKNNSNV